MSRGSRKNSSFIKASQFSAFKYNSSLSTVKSYTFTGRLSFECSTHFDVNDLSSELLRDNFVECVRRMKLNDFLGDAVGFCSCGNRADESESDV
jgi:hypothetical protein